MRLRNAPLRTFALGAAVALVAAWLHPPEAAAQDAAVNGASAATERILSELRAGKGTSAALDDATDAAAPALRLDGVPEQPAQTPVSPDGLLRDSSVQQQPVDGDLSADGKPVALSDQATDPVVEASPEPPPAKARTVESVTSARAAAGRSRPVAEDDTAAPHPEPPPADDTVGEDASDLDPPVAPPAPQPAVTDVELDPYAPVGTKRGGFLLLPSLTAETIYSDNVHETASTPHNDVGLVLRPGFSLQSQWSQHAFTFDLRGAMTDWHDNPSADLSELHTIMRGRLDVTSRSSLEADAAYDFNTVPAGDPTVAVGTATRPTTHTETAGLAYNQTFDRLTLRLHGTAAATSQSDSGSGGQTYIDDTLDGRAAYELSPALMVFGTAKTLLRDYADASGVDAKGDEAKVGVETDRSAKLSGSFDVGLAGISATNGGGSGASGLVADASLTWLPSALTTVTLAAATNIEPTDAAGTAAARTSVASIDVKHQFRRWLSLMTGLSETAHDYAGLGLSDVERTGHLGFEYDISRQWALLADIQRTALASSDATRSYTEDQIRFGVRVQN